MDVIIAERSAIEKICRALDMESPFELRPGPHSGVNLVLRKRPR